MYWQYYVQLNEVFHSKMLIHLPILVIVLALDEDVHMLRLYFLQILLLFNEIESINQSKILAKYLYNILPFNSIL